MHAALVVGWQLKALQKAIAFQAFVLECMLHTLQLVSDIITCPDSVSWEVFCLTNTFALSPKVLMSNGDQSSIVWTSLNSVGCSPKKRKKCQFLSLDVQLRHFQIILWLVSKLDPRSWCLDAVKIPSNYCHLTSFLLYWWTCIKCPDLKIFAIVGAQWKIVGWSKEKSWVFAITMFDLTIAAQFSNQHPKQMICTENWCHDPLDVFPFFLRLHFWTISRPKDDNGKRTCFFLLRLLRPSLGSELITNEFFNKFNVRLHQKHRLHHFDPTSDPYISLYHSAVACRTRYRTRMEEVFQFHHIASVISHGNTLKHGDFIFLHLPCLTNLALVCLTGCQWYPTCAYLLWHALDPWW